MCDMSTGVTAATFVYVCAALVHVSHYNPVQQQQQQQHKPHVHTYESV